MNFEPDNPPLDVAIVGAGIAGVIHLHYARQAGLNALVFEKGPAVGGLWRTLPAWQDIQISPADWALAGMPMDGPLQPQVLANIEAWVQRFALADGIRLDTPVEQARPVDGGWELQTPAGVVRARHLVAATGAHNRPVIPAVLREASEVQEWHSSTLRDPSLLRGRDVLVVGGGASAFDLLDLCLDHGARRVAWAYRGLKWFVPTRQPKHIAGSVRGFARLQASGLSPAEQSATLNADMRGRYAKFGIEALLPPQPFDVLKDQLIPGRPRMLAHFGDIRRLPGSVASIAGRTVTIDGSGPVEADVLLWGTGFEMDLHWIDVPALAAVHSSDALAARCGCIFRSLDAGNLVLPQTGLDGIGAAPWAYALLARTVMSHIRGTARLDLASVGHKVNHFDIVAHLAPRDPASFPPERWQAHYREIALGTPDDQPYPVP
jgi:cation diffusion facilitator CzcD-associated flavoprotein CzcO